MSSGTKSARPPGTKAGGPLVEQSHHQEEVLPPNWTQQLGQQSLYVTCIDWCSRKIRLLPALNRGLEPPGFGASSAGGSGASRTGGLKGSTGSSNVAGNSGTSGLLGDIRNAGDVSLGNIRNIFESAIDRPFALRRAAASRSESAILRKIRTFIPVVSNQPSENLRINKYLPKNLPMPVWKQHLKRRLTSRL